MCCSFVGEDKRKCEEWWRGSARITPAEEYVFPLELTVVSNQVESCACDATDCPISLDR